ncbi:MAG: AAA family ATPase, partial [Nannocystaceae bacterium]
VHLQQKSEATARELIELASWERRLEAAETALTRGGLSPQLKAETQHKTVREREAKGVRAVTEHLQALRLLLQTTATSHLHTLGDALPEPAGPNAEVVGQLRADIERLRTEVEILLSPVVERLTQLEQTQAKARATLEEAHAKQQEVYTTLMAEAKAHQVRLQARDEAAAQVARLTQAKQSVADLAHEATAAQNVRKQLIQNFRELREQRFAARNTQATQISEQLGGRVRVRFEKQGASEAFREFLVSIMRRSGRQYNAPIDRLIAAVTPKQLTIFVDSGDHESLAGMADVTADFAQSLTEQLAEQPARRLALDSIELEEVPRIELRLGDVWRSTEQLSTGQKSAALLPILLLESEAPLLIDQPEDNLDNRYISDAIVPQIREVKTRRQLLCITHNPNLPVLGDAENVCVLAADGRRSQLKSRGTVPDVRDDIVRLMEGGIEAFRRRQQEYERPVDARS